MRLDPENIPPRGGLMVHAVKSHVPICHLPQAMEFSSDWKRGEVSIEAISGTTKLTLARMSAIAILRRWLPVIWGKSSLRNQELQPNAEDAQSQPGHWSINPTDDPMRVKLSIPGFSPITEFNSAELENALMLSCAGIVEATLKGEEFPVHDITIKHERVRNINNRIHDIAQEVDQIDL